MILNRMMRRLYVLVILIFLLFGCSNEATVQAESTKSLEQQITSVISDNQLSNKEIIDYEMKDLQ